MAIKADYTEKQLSNMVINPAVKGRVVDSYPHILPIVAKMPTELDSDAFVRFIAYLYDPASPLIKAMPQLAERKKQAEALTGFKAVQEHAQTIVLCLQQVFKSMEWTVIVSIERMFEEFTERVNEPIGTTKTISVRDKSDGSISLQTVPVDDEDILKAVERKIKLKDEMRKMTNELKELRDAFFGGDAALIEEAKRPIRSPEDNAKEH